MKTPRQRCEVACPHLASKGYGKDSNHMFCVPTCANSLGQKKYMFKIALCLTSYRYRLEFCLLKLLGQQLVNRASSSNHLSVFYDLYLDQIGKFGRKDKA